MIDRDDREEGPEEGDVSSIEPSADETSSEDTEAAGTQADAGEAAAEEPVSDESPAAEEQPAMQLEAGSDEGGTIESGGDEAAEAAESAPTSDPEELAAEDAAEASAPADQAPRSEPVPEPADEPAPADEAGAAEQPAEETSTSDAPVEQDPLAFASPADPPVEEPAEVAEEDIIKDPITGEMVYAHSREPVGEEAAFDGDGLGLVSDDDGLPWLESSDYDDIESVDAWRITGFVVLGLVLLALLVGGIWYFTNRDGNGMPIADGSIISAPDGPYKERPEDPGGKTFEGTGDMAPAVGEGETREGRLAEKSATPEPVAEPAEEPEEAPSTPAANDGRIGVQVGAYRDQATAEAGWRALQRQTDALSGVEYRIVQGEADIGTVYRLQALPGDMAAARRLSQALKDDGVPSQIKQ